MSVRKGTPREIATQGISSPDGLGIGTQGFIEPIIGDLITGGHAIVDFRPVNLITGGEAIINRAYAFAGDGGLIIDGGTGLIVYRPRYIGSGGLVFGGEADIVYSIQPVVGGNVVIGGGAGIELTFNITPDGGLIVDGEGNVNVSYLPIVGDPEPDGTEIETGGEAGIVFAPGAIVGDGGLIIDGEAIVNDNLDRDFGRGGAISGRRVPRLPNTEFEFPIFNPDDYLEPMDYLKKIQDALDKVEKEKLEIFRYLSKGTIQINGRGKVVAVYRDQPDGKMVVANNPPLEPIVLDLPSVFNSGQTAIEIAELEDHLLLNDLMGLGDYTIKRGVKNRYVQHGKKSAGGEAKVKFVSGAGTVKHVNIKRRRQMQEDDELLLGLNRKRKMSRQERDDEELRLLGFLDD